MQVWQQWQRFAQRLSFQPFTLLHFWTAVPVLPAYSIEFPMQAACVKAIFFQYQGRLLRHSIDDSGMTSESFADFVEYAFLHMDKGGSLKGKWDLDTPGALDVERSSVLQ